MKEEDVLNVIDRWKERSDANTDTYSWLSSFYGPKVLIRDFIIIKEELWRAAREIYPDNHKRVDPIELTRAIGWINSLKNEIMQREGYTEEEIKEYLESRK